MVNENLLTLLDFSTISRRFSPSVHATPAHIQLDGFHKSKNIRVIQVTYIAVLFQSDTQPDFYFPVFL